MPRFLELAAKQVAVARGLGYAGVYLAGQRNAREVDSVLEMADRYGPDDWRGLAARSRSPSPRPSDSSSRTATHLASDAATIARKRPSRGTVPLGLPLRSLRP